MLSQRLLKPARAALACCLVVALAHAVVRAEDAPGPTRQSRLVIKKAVYGDLPQGSQIDVTEKVGKMVEDDSLAIDATNSNFTDPAVGIAKKLMVDYSVDGKQECKTVNEGATLTISGAGPADTLALPHKAGFHNLFYSGKIGDQPLRMAYSIFLPRNYDANPQARPLIVYLHGGGEAGNNHQGLYIHGPIAEMNRNKDLADWADFLVLAPQLPGGVNWGSPGVPELVIDITRYAMAHWRVDPDRVYLTGESMGGTGTWHAAMTGKGMFAAIVPTSAREVMADKMAGFVADSTVWIICGGADGDFTVGSHNMFKALQTRGVDVLLCDVPGAGHLVYDRFYSQRAMYQFMLLHQRGQKPPASRPVAEQLLAMAYVPPNSMDAKLAGAYKTFLPWWQLLNCGNSADVGLKPELAGRRNVFVTCPLDDATACRMLVTLPIPKGKRPTLDMTVGSPPQGQWVLAVRANGREVFNRTIGSGPGAPAAGEPAGVWTEVRVDMSAYAGQDVQLQVLNQSAGKDKNSTAWWGKLGLGSRE